MIGTKMRGRWWLGMISRYCSTTLLVSSVDNSVIRKTAGRRHGNKFRELSKLRMDSIRTTSSVQLEWDEKKNTLLVLTILTLLMVRSTNIRKSMCDRIELRVRCCILLDYWGSYLWSAKSNKLSTYFQVVLTISVAFFKYRIMINKIGILLVNYAWT